MNSACRAPAFLAVLGLVAGAWFVGSVDGARADGEAGVVIDWGNGTSTARCVAFRGDSIDGFELLTSAGFSVNEFSGLVCSIDRLGCSHSGTFNSCTCQCRTGSESCLYWSFFTRDYGSPWRYSATGFRSQSASNGDLQAWQWLPSTPTGRPPLPVATFEDVCGHLPQVATSAPALTVVPPRPLSTAVVEASPVAGPAPTLASSPVGLASPAPSPTETAPSSPTDVTPTSSPSAPAVDDSDTGSRTAALRFGVVAGALLVASLAAYVWRARRGH